MLTIIMVFLSTQIFSDETCFMKYEDLLQDKVVRDVMNKGPFLMINETVPAKLKPATIGMTFNAPPDRIWKVMTDYKNYGAMFFSIGNTDVVPEVLEQTKDRVSVRFKIELADFSLIKIYIDCIQKVTFDKPLNKMNISWENARVIISPKGIPRWLFVKVIPRAEGQIKNASGTFEFIPIENGKKTAVFCTAKADFRDTVIGANTLIGKFPELEPMITLSGLRITMEAIKKEAEKK
jgi:hypothetical protein